MSNHLALDRGQRLLHKTMISSKTKIGLLVAGHVVAGLLLAWAVYTWAIGISLALAACGLFSLFLAEAALFGIWAALGTTGWRFLAAVMTPIYLFVVFVTASKGWGWKNLEVDVLFFSAFAVPTAVIFLVLCGLRHRRRGFCLIQMGTPSRPPEGLQFTLRHLFILTAIAAALLAVGRGLEHFPATGDGSKTAILFAVVFPYLILIELATLWAALGTGRPLPLLLVVLPIAFVVGAIPPFYLKTLLRMPSDWKVYLICSSVMGLQATLLAVSLLVIRSCGWRLWKMKSEPVLDQPTPYSEPLAERLRQSLAGRLEEKEFALGGVRFLLNGHMCLGVWKNSLVARIGPEQSELALKQKHVTEFNVTGLPIRGVVLVAPEGMEHDDQLNEWIRRAEEFVMTLPGK
jgi:hypothetical protein